MRPSDFHPLLQKQINDALGELELTPQLLALLRVISDSYKKSDETVDLRTQQLMASTSRAYSFLDSINMGFIMCDTSGEVVLTNSSLRQMIGQPEGSINVAALDQAFGTELDIGGLIRQCLQTSRPVQRGDISFGKLVLRMYLAPLLNEPGTPNQQSLGVVILMEDITDQKMLERSKDEFLSIASHELRTPLTAIRGNAALIQKYYADKIPDPEMTEIIDDIHASSINLIGIVNDFLDVAALEQGKMTMKPEVFAMQQVVTEVVRELGNMCADKGINLVHDPSVGQIPSVMADHQRIKQVVINLVGNAVKFTEKGSITISGQADDKFAYVTVMDTGKGMSPENQKLLFRKFQQAGSSLLTRDATHGTGLGLYISKQIVELSGGRIGLKSSTEGVGSAFTFSLPLAST